MKKLFIILFLGLISLTVFSQERTVTKLLGKGDTYYKYTGVTLDALVPTTRDTIDIIFQVRVDERIEKIEVKSRFDMLTTADTTVKVSVFGRNFTDDTYTSMIASTTSDAVTTDNVIQVLTGGYTESHVTAAYNLTEAAYNMTSDTATFKYYPADTIAVASHIIAAAEATTTVTPVDYSFRFIRVRYIISGNDITGTGIQIDEVELILKY